MSSLVILAASIFEISSGKTDKQRENSTSAISLGVGSNNNYYNYYNNNPFMQDDLGEPIPGKNIHSLTPCGTWAL